MYKKIEFAKILSSSIEDDTDDVNKESELDLIDSLIKDVDLKKNYNSRYNFYINFIKMYQKDPNIIRYIYTKLNTIKNLNEKEKDLLSKLNYTSYNSKGGGNPKNNILKRKIIELIKKIKISKIKNKEIVNNLRSDLKKLIINVYGNNIKEANCAGKIGTIPSSSDREASWLYTSDSPTAKVDPSPGKYLRLGIKRWLKSIISSPAFPINLS